MFQKIVAALITFSIIATTNLAAAGTVKVIQKKGSKAIIEGPFVSTLAVGATYDVGEGTSTASTTHTRNVAGISGKKYSINGGAGFAFSTMKLEGSTSSENYTAIQVFGRFGINKDPFEFGPILSWRTAKIGSVNSDSSTLGGFFDYNMPNAASSTMIFGPSASYEIISGSVLLITAAGTTSSSYSGNQIKLGGFIKWFPYMFPFCIRTDIYYQIGKDNYSSSTSQTGGLAATVGASLYF